MRTTSLSTGYYFEENSRGEVCDDLFKLSAGASEIRQHAEVQNKIHMVYHGVDVGKFATAHREHPNGIFTFLHVGRLSPEKAQDRIIEACALLRGNGLKFICLIVGDGPLFGDLKAMIEALNLQDYVNLVGRVFHEQVRSYYLCADAFVLSSIRDNLPNVLLESLAAGVPVIVPRIGAITELVYDGVNGIVVDGGGSKSLADAMLG